ncbi:hypothetical protein BS47DRAFT_310269 [Hydnum rufescens UP504]|uniref:Uncharacterized protein n=1 Tax=Hydnum rufescens UP504 TaxID=1448309 RepID=A0A9P6AKB1_9AGAM|nr:hypothetical protein BS47DRAFT_310269 [Hydnum rufescens UP504]
MSLPSPLKPPRRIVTGHTPDGRSTTIFNEEVTFKISGDVPAPMARLWVTKGIPVDNNCDQTIDMKDVVPDRLSLVSTNGTHLCMVDIPPFIPTPDFMHRTSSIDYAILISGEITLILEDGSETTLTEPGSIVVQRGTLHDWKNRGTGWTRFIAVLIDASPVHVSDEQGVISALPEMIPSPKMLPNLTETAPSLPEIVPSQIDEVFSSESSNSASQEPRD